MARGAALDGYVATVGPGGRGPDGSGPGGNGPGGRSPGGRGPDGRSRIGGRSRMGGDDAKGLGQLRRLRRFQRRVGAAEIPLAPAPISGHWKIQRSVPIVAEHSGIFGLQVGKFPNCHHSFNRQYFPPNKWIPNSNSSVDARWSSCIDDGAPLSPL